MIVKEIEVRDIMTKTSLLSPCTESNAALAHKQTRLHATAGSAQMPSAWEARAVFICRSRSSPLRRNSITHYKQLIRGKFSEMNARWPVTPQ